MENKYLKFSIIIIVLAIVAITVVLFGGISAYQYFAKQNFEVGQSQEEQNVNLSVQSQQVTEGWKIYTNSQYGFEIRHPQNENVSLVDFVPSRGTNLILPDNNFIEKNGTVGNILNFFIFQKSTNNLEKYISDDLSAANAVNDKYNLPRSSYEKININGTTAYKINY